MDATSISFSGLKTKTIVAVLSAVLATSALGYWSYGEYRQQELRSAVTGLVKDTSLRMRDALTAGTVSTPADTAMSLRKLYDDAEAVDGNFRTLHGMDVAPVEALAGAADDYVLTSREILLRWASSHRYRVKLSGSIEALRNHMREDDRTGAWVSGAIRAKERVEEDYRDYRIATSALGNLLASYPDSRAKMAPYVDPELLADEALVEEARKQVLAVSGQTADEIETVRQLITYR